MSYFFNLFGIFHPSVVITLLSIGLTVQGNALTPPNTSANRKSAPIFDGKVMLQNGEILEFVWVEEISLWVGKYEITLGQLTDFLPDAKKRPAHYAARDVAGSHDLSNFPAVHVSWDDASNACKTLNGKYGYKLPPGSSFRLPTEEEWNAIARTGDNRKYPWGNSWPPSPMTDGIPPNLQGIEMIPSWEKHLSDSVIVDYKDKWASFAPVAKSGVNEWGIYGLAGNVKEWCEGWYDQDQKLRLLKGSSVFTYNARESKIAHRSKVEGQSPARGWFFWGTIRNQGHISSGFRVVIEQREGGGAAQMGAMDRP